MHTTSLNPTSLETPARRTRTQRARRPLVALLVVVVSLVGFAGFGTPSAEAQTWAWSTYTGQVAASAYATADGYNDTIRVNPNVVGPVAAYGSYSQYVCVTSQLDQVVFAGAYTSDRPFWKAVATNRRCGWITNGSFVDWGNTFRGTGNGTGYSVNLTITWQLSNGNYIGTKTVDFDRAADYRCINGGCAISTSYWGGGAVATLF